MSDLTSKNLQPFLRGTHGVRGARGFSRPLRPNPIATSGYIVPSGLQVGLPPELQAASHLTHWIVL